MLFALAVATGSIGNVLALVMYLKNGTETLPKNAAPFLHRLEKMETELKLSMPLPGSTSGDFYAKLSCESSEKAKEDHICTTVTSDGAHLFTWDGSQCSISKIGTGFHGTIAGNEYAVNSDIIDSIRNHLQDSVYDPESQAGQGETPSQPSVVTGGTASAESASPNAPTRIRLTGEGMLIVIDENADIVEACREEEFEDTDTLEEGQEFDVLSTHTVNAVGHPDVECTAYHIGSGRYVLNVSQQEISDHEGSRSGNGSDDDDHSERFEFVNVVDVISGGDASASSGTSRLKEFQSANIVFASGKLYLWMKYLLGPFRVAVISTSALKLEDVIEVNLPIPEIVKARQLWNKKRNLSSSSVVATDGSAMEESKEEGALQEEKNNEEDRVNLPNGGAADVVPEEEELETRLGPETILSSPGTSCAIFSTSSRNTDFSSASAQDILCIREFSSDEGDAFAFADGDLNQEIILDLGGFFCAVMSSICFWNNPSLDTTRDVTRSSLLLK